MPIPSELTPLAQQDELRELTGLDKPVFIHKDHRWNLVILHWAQQTGLTESLE